MPRPAAGQKLRTFTEVPRDLWSRKGIQNHWESSFNGAGTVIVGDDTGLIKLVSVKKKGAVIRTWGQQDPNKRIVHLCWHNQIKEFYTTDKNQVPALKQREEEFLAVLSNGDIQCWNTMNGRHRTVIKGEEHFVG